MTKKESWCLAYRQGCLTRGQNTNNYCEATIRIVKDIIFNRYQCVLLCKQWAFLNQPFNIFRCKAFNICELLKFMAEVYNQHFINKILNILLQRKRTISFDSPLINVDLIRTTENSHIFLVESETNQSTIYEVDISLGTCTCPIGHNGSMCKHQRGVIFHKNMQPPNLYLQSEEEKHFYSILALGRDAPPSGFFPSQDKSFQATTSLNNITNDTEIDDLIRNNRDVTTGKKADSIVDTNKALIDDINKLMSEKLQKVAERENATAALIKFKDKLTHCRTNEQFLSAVQKFGPEIRHRNSGKKIMCQPTAISRRPAGVSKGAAPLSRGKRPNGTNSNKRKKRARNLAASIKINVANAKSH